jgi:hypothetical protein
MQFVAVLTLYKSVDALVVPSVLNFLDSVKLNQECLAKDIYIFAYISLKFTHCRQNARFFINMHSIAR